MTKVTTNASSYSWLTPQVSSSEKVMGECSVLCCLVGLSVVSIYSSLSACICLTWDFITELDSPPLVSPPAITLIFPIRPSALLSFWVGDLDRCPHVWLRVFPPRTFTLALVELGLLSAPSSQSNRWYHDYGPCESDSTCSDFSSRARLGSSQATWC